MRETSHKPDEIYGIIERLAPGSRKVELFGRPHNVQPNWLVRYLVMIVTSDDSNLAMIVDLLSLQQHFVTKTLDRTDTWNTMFLLNLYLSKTLNIF